MNASTIWNLLGDAAIKAAILLLAAAILTFAMRRASAAMRHVVWAAATVMTLMLPIGIAFLPAHRITLPVWLSVNSPPAQALSIAALPPKIDQKSNTLDRPIISREPSQQQSTPPTEQPGILPAQRPVAANSASHPLTQLPFIALSIWFVGLVLVAIYWIIGFCAAAKMRRPTAHIVSGRAFDASQHAQRRLGLQRIVQLRVGPHVTMPLTVGTWRPRVFLPLAAETWSCEQLQSALLHELAHVQRFDCAVQWLTNVACAIYWFNPLVWLAAARLRIERERACDDRVLNQGTTATNYAEHLLAVARALQNSTRWHNAAIAMARPSGLRMRLTKILEPRVCRDAASWPIVSVVAVLSTAALLSLSCVHTAASNTDKPHATSTVQPADASQSEKHVAPPTTTKPSWARLVLKPVLVTVLNKQTGQPVEGAEVDYDNMSAKTDAKGQATMQYDVLQFSVWCPHYINNRITWERAKDYSGLPPSEYTVRLDPASSIGGKVVDDAGKPVAGANVEIYVNGTGRHEDDEFIETPWINRAVVTDADGTWHFDRVPPNPAKPIKVAVWDYQHLDGDFFFLKEYTPQSALRDKTATFTLPAGVAITGTVVDPFYGDPVSHATLSFGDDQNASNKIPPLDVDAKGKFSITIKPGTHLTLTAAAPGCRPQVRQFTASEKPENLEFDLTPTNFVK